MFFEKYTQKIFMPYDAIDTETEKLLPLNNVQMSVLKKVNPKTRLFLLTNQLHDDIYLELSLGGIYDSFKYLSATPEHLTEWQLIYEETGKNTEAWVKLLMI
jgi:type IV secretory pathway VirB4 component